MIGAAIGRFIRREQFHPGIAGLFVNPFYFARKGLAAHMRRAGAELSGTLLDVGCGVKPYAAFTRASLYVGAEVRARRGAQRRDSADVYYDGTRLPFRDGTFDSLIASEVLEHLFTPEEFLAEAHRVLKSGGTMLITVPFLWPEHLTPGDFGRYSSYGLAHLLGRKGFTVVRQEKSMNDIRAALQMLACYVHRRTETRSGAANLLLCALLIGPINIAGELLALILPKNDELYLDNIVLARKGTNA